MGGGNEVKKFYTTGEVARMFGVAPSTVWLWVKEGRIHAIRTLGGRYRIPADEVERLKREMSG